MESEIEGGFIRNSCRTKEADSSSGGACDDQQDASYPQMALPSRVEEEQVVGGGVLSITGVRDAHVIVHTVDLNKKDTYRASTSSLLAKGTKMAVQDEGAHGYDDHAIENSKEKPRSPSAPAELLQKENNGLSSAVSGLSPKSDLSEFPSSKHDTSVVQSPPCSRSERGNSFCENAVSSKDCKGNETCHRQKELSECLKEDSESSLAGQFAADIADGHRSAALPNDEDIKSSNTIGEASLGSLQNTGPLETGMRMDREIPTDENMKSSRVNEQLEKSSFLVKSSNMLPQITESESENSVAIEDDVKVCDICGDAGREELLAICSRCSDGAEHTYCMWIKLDKLPEGNWLCEECKLKEETERQEGDKSETVPGASKVPCSNEHGKNIGSTFEPKLLPKLVTEPLDEAARGASKEPQISNKRHDGNVEVTSMAAKKASETSVGYTGTRKEAIFCRGGSFNKLDMGKVKPSKLASSYGGQSTNSSQPVVRSQTSVSNSSNIQSGFQSSGGPPTKSVSLNHSIMKPKVKQLTGTIPQMQKLPREYASSNTKKKELVKEMTKSTSFKGMSLGHSNVGSISKIQLPPRRAEDTRGMELVRERSAIEKRNLVDRPLVSPKPVNATSIPLPKPDLKVLQTAESNIFGINREPDDANSLVKQQSSHISKSSISTSSNGLCNSEDEKPCQVLLNNSLHSRSIAAYRSCSNPDTDAQRNATQSVEFARCDDKIKDPTYVCSTKQAVSGGIRTLHCQKCNETGHSTQNCLIDKIRITALKPSADRNLKERAEKSSKWKDAVEMAMSKTTVQKNDRLANQTQKFLVSGTHLNFEVAPKNSVSSSSDCVRNLPSLKGTSDGQEILTSVVADPNKTGVVTDQRSPSLHEAGALCVPRASELNSASTISDELNVKPSMQIFPDQASVLLNPLRASVIPELEFIWQGGFEVLRTGRHPELCEGVQAHLSTCASPKVLEVATKFPCRVQVDEVPRVSSWPMQFQGNGPKDDNIALFFFAKDIQSYEKNYRNLLENMLQNDLALKGNIDGLELLIFPSNKLPENSQRWNRLFFLWGVFKRINSLEALSGLQEMAVESTLNAKPLSAPFISEASVSPKTISIEDKDEELSMCSGSSKDKAVKLFANMDVKSISSSGVEDSTSHTQESDLVQKFQAAVDNKLPSEHSSCSFPKNLNSDSQCGKGDATYVCASTPNCKQSVGSEEKQKSMKSEVLDYNLQEDVAEIDRMSWESRVDRKRAHSPSLNTTSHASDETLKCTGETMQWTKKANSTTVDGKKENKKMKSDTGGYTSCCSTVESSSNKLSSNIHLLSASSLNKSVCDETLMLESSSSAGRHFIDVDFGLAKDAKTDNVIYVLSSDDEAAPESNAPNLELALGGEKKSPKKEILPLFSPKNGKRSNQDNKLHGPSMDDGHEGSASLTLSLAFPASE